MAGHVETNDKWREMAQKEAEDLRFFATSLATLLAENRRYEEETDLFDIYIKLIEASISLIKFCVN